MDKLYKIFASFIALFILLTLPAISTENKTAYTRDGIHYVSKERVDENIRYEYAKPGDYKEVLVPFDTIVTGASTIPENLTEQEGIGGAEINSQQKSNRTASAPVNKYPYASPFIGLLAIGGLVIFVASVFSGRDRQ
jgi:hypothetical protein